MRLLVLLSMLVMHVHAKVETVTFEDGQKVSFELPTGWEFAKDLYGMPLVILGPWKNQARPALSILPTSFTKKIVEPDSLKELFIGFKKQKESWVESHKGQLISFNKPESVKMTEDIVGHFIGAEFKINGIHFVERSYYLYCKDQIYNVKYTIRGEQRKYSTDLEKIVRGFKCH